MKISWGTSLVLAIIGFISFIMFFVVTMITDEAYSHDLVVEEYYKNELSFQEQLDKTQNATKLPENIQVHRSRQGLVITFPKDFDHTMIKGNLFLYRPSNKQLDVEIPLSLSTNQLLVPDKSLLGGRWNIIIDWEYGTEKYYFREDINY